MQADPAFAERASRCLRALKSLSLKTPGFEVTIDIDALRGVADSGDLEDDLTDLFVELGEAARSAGRGVLYCLDEAHHLGGADAEAFLAALHRISQQKLPLVVVAAGLPILPRLTAEARTYAERLFNPRPVDVLTEDAARHALAEPALALGVEYSDLALRTIVTRTHAVPYFLQEYGRIVWDTAVASPIMPSDVEAARPKFIAHLDANFFVARLDRLPKTERDYVIAMTAMGLGRRNVADISRRLGKGSPARISDIRDRLMERGLIYSPSPGFVAFTIPAFGEYVSRRYHREVRDATLAEAAVRPTTRFRGFMESILDATFTSFGEYAVGGDYRSYSYELAMLTVDSFEVPVAYDAVPASASSRPVGEEWWLEYENIVSGIPESFLILASQRRVEFDVEPLTGKPKAEVGVRRVPSQRGDEDAKTVYVLDLSQVPTVPQPRDRRNVGDLIERVKTDIILRLERQ